MKFNWGTGIFIFLILFLLACFGFIYFAFQQDVNLVHKDYYEKGVDYNQQMKVDSRSAKYYNDLNVYLEDEFLIVKFKESLASTIDSGNALLYRPSDSKQDVSVPLELNNNVLKIPKSNLISGRYILKLYWVANGEKFEVDKPVNIQ
jgi:hypothetical protein